MYPIYKRFHNQNHKGELVQKKHKKETFTKFKIKSDSKSFNQFLIDVSFILKSPIKWEIWEFQYWNNVWSFSEKNTIGRNFLMFVEDESQKFYHVLCSNKKVSKKIKKMLNN